MKREERSNEQMTREWMEGRNERRRASGMKDAVGGKGMR